MDFETPSTSTSYLWQSQDPLLTMEPGEDRGQPTNNRYLHVFIYYQLVKLCIFLQSMFDMCIVVRVVSEQCLVTPMASRHHGCSGSLHPLGHWATARGLWRTSGNCRRYVCPLGARTLLGAPQAFPDFIDLKFVSITHAKPIGPCHVAKGRLLNPLQAKINWTCFQETNLLWLLTTT